MGVTEEVTFSYLLVILLLALFVLTIFSESSREKTSISFQGIPFECLLKTFTFLPLLIITKHKGSQVESLTVEKAYLLLKKKNYSDIC